MFDAKEADEKGQRKGQPLVSMDVIISLIGNTTSRTGLKVDAMEDRNTYPTKRKITDEQMEALNLIRMMF